MSALKLDNDNQIEEKKTEINNVLAEENYCILSVSCQIVCFADFWLAHCVMIYHAIGGAFIARTTHSLLLLLLYALCVMGN